jgi:C4-dicarboxylate-binding protein DctP
MKPVRSILTVALGLALCAFCTDAPAAEYVMKVAFTTPETDGITIGSRAFAKFVAEKTGGDLEVQVYPGGQMGSEREMIEGVQMGILESAVPSTGLFANMEPNSIIFDIPYMFANLPVAYEVLDGPLGVKLRQIFLDKTGIRILAFTENGYRHYTNSVREVSRPSDLKGLKIRTMENPIHMDITRATGAIPTPLPFLETYTALAQKVVDGQENPISLIVAMRFCEAQKFMTLDGHVYSPLAILINNDFYRSLPDNYRAIVDEGAILWRDTIRQARQKQDAEGIAEIRKVGVQITELTPEQLAEFRAVTKPVADGIRAKLDPELVKLLDEEMAKAEAKYLKK